MTAPPEQDALGKCSTENGRILPCDALQSVTEEGGQGTRYQGVKNNWLINNKTGSFSRTLLSLKSGKHSRLGVFLNFCPFCGESIVPDVAADGSSTEDVAAA